MTNTGGFGNINHQDQSQSNIEENIENPQFKGGNSPGGTYAFKAISRNRSVITQKYYGSQDSPDPAQYRPNHQPVEKKEITLKFKYSE